MARVWPTREEWEADAERATRFACFGWERLPDGLDFTTAAEAAERERLLAELELLKPAVCRALDARITELRADFPDRPRAGKARIAWMLDLEGDAYQMACHLVMYEQSRSGLRTGKTHVLGVLRTHYLLEDALWRPAHRRMVLLHNKAQLRRDQAAALAEQAAVDAEIARRRTDEAWLQQLERRARIDGPRVTPDPRSA